MPGTVSYIFSLLNPFSYLGKRPQDFLGDYIRKNDTGKVISFVKDNLEFINVPTSSGHFPVEFALSNKNIPLAQYLLLNGADLNLSEIKPNHPSPLDQVILQDDPELLQGVLGTVLGTIFSITHKNIKKASPQTFQNALRRSVDDFTFLANDIKRYENKLSLTDSPLWNLLVYSPKNLRHEIIASRKDEFTNNEVFSVMCASILNHENEVIELLYNIYGDPILTLQTTDFKNLYHIAAIADNTIAIRMLSNWGLTIQSNASFDELGLYSPFHYAMMHTSLNTFIALTQAPLPYPASLPLNLIGSDSIIPSVHKMKLSPSQLFILKAYITNPLLETPKEVKLYLLIEASIWAILLAKEQFKFSTSFGNIFFFIKNSLVIARTSYMCSELYNDLKGSFSKGLFNGLSKALCYGSIFSLFNNSLEPLLSSFYKRFSLLVLALQIKKIWSDFSCYQKAYLFRPKKTIAKAIENFFCSALFFRNSVYDYPNFLKEAKEEKDWDSFFRATFNYESFQKTVRKYPTTSLPNPKEPGLCNELYAYRTSAIEQLSSRISDLTEKIVLCCFKKVKEINSLFAHKSSSLIECLLHAHPNLNEKAERKVYRELNKLLHPDKCGKNDSPFSDEFCEKFEQKYSFEFNDWFKRRVYVVKN